MQGQERFNSLMLQESWIAARRSRIIQSPLSKLWSRSKHCAIADSAPVAPLAWADLVPRQLQQLCWLNIESLGQPADDLQTRVEGALFELAQIAAADLCLIGEIILREPLFVAKAAQT